MYDFAVVGAGPAGSRFARQAADRGYDVVVFERGEVGRPLACSGHVSTDLWAYLPQGARADLRQNEIRGARFHTAGPGAETTPKRFYRETPISNVIDRVALDRRLAELARTAGAEVRPGHTVTAVTEHDTGVSLTVRTAATAREDDSADHEPIAADGGRTTTWRARMVVGADGPRSRVRDALELPDPDEFLHGVLGFVEAPDGGSFVDVHLTPPTFFAWRIPRGAAGVEYGLAMPPDAAAERGVADRFDAFCSAYGATVTRRCSGLIPIGPPDRTVSRRGFLVGDAAGQTKPFTGGGILYGLRAADHAARTVDPTDPSTLSAYETAWREDLEREIALGRWIRRAYELPTPLQRAGLRTLSGEIGVHMDRPSTLFSRDQLRALLPGG